mgnify:CR=1 FL=1
MDHSKVALPLVLRLVGGRDEVELGHVRGGQLQRRVHDVRGPEEEERRRRVMRSDGAQHLLLEQ